MKKVLSFLIGVILTQLITAQTTVNYAGDVTTNFANPERGIHVTQECWSDNNQYLTQQITASFLNNIKNTKPYVTLIKRRYLLYNLNNTATLPSWFTTLLNAEFTEVRNAGFKMIVHVLYTNVPGGADAPVSIMQGHFQQLKTTWENNQDVIACFAMGFVGQFGEWTTSTNNNLDPANMTTIMNSWLDNSPVSRMTTMRVPKHQRQVFGTTPLTLSQAYSTTLKAARVGSHNDSYSSNITDWGTFYLGEGATTAQDAEIARAYIAAETEYTVQSGETSGLCAEPASDKQYQQCSAALDNAKRCHYSSLSHYELWDQTAQCSTIPTWTNGGCEETIQRLLGYRFRLISGSFPSAAVTTNTLSISLSMINDGWARIYNKRNVELVLQNTSTNAVTRIAVNGVNTTTDSRLWLPGQAQTKTLTCVVDLPAGLANGSYKLYLNLPDPMGTLNTRPEYSIRLANSNMWDATRGYNDLNYTITLNRSSTVTYFRIKNRWKPTYYMYENGGQVKYGTNAATDYTSQWSTETTGGYTRFKNRSTGHYINNDNTLAYTECTTSDPTYWGSHWTVQDYQGYKRMLNRWKSTEYLNIDHLYGYVEHYASPLDYWGSHWTFETVTAAAGTTSTASLETIINNTRVNKDVNIYPIPAKSILTVANIAPNANISILSSEGKIIANVKVNTGTYQFNVAKWNRGIYLIKIKSANGTIVKKVMIGE